MTLFRPHDRVEIVTDRFADKGDFSGAIGSVVERWDDGALEIEVMNPDRSTAAQVVAQPADQLFREGAAPVEYH